MFILLVTQQTNDQVKSGILDSSMQTWAQRVETLQQKTKGRGRSKHKYLGNNQEITSYLTFAK